MRTVSFKVKMKAQRLRQLKALAKRQKMTVNKLVQFIVVLNVMKLSNTLKMSEGK